MLKGVLQPSLVMPAALLPSLGWAGALLLPLRLLLPPELLLDTGEREAAPSLTSLPVCITAAKAASLPPLSSRPVNRAAGPANCCIPTGSFLLAPAATWSLLCHRLTWSTAARKKTRALALPQHQKARTKQVIPQRLLTPFCCATRFWVWALRHTTAAQTLLLPQLLRLVAVLPTNLQAAHETGWPLLAPFDSIVPKRTNQVNLPILCLQSGQSRKGCWRPLASTCGRLPSPHSRYWTLLRSRTISTSTWWTGLPRTFWR
mmetsp:Transcript_38638/g.76041  ORF Transcript_38638/g.76041 Transcript_38638/m.76041 type:complete len:260 (+) Transcript_38638:1018-1797(+)